MNSTQLYKIKYRVYMVTGNIKIQKRGFSEISFERLGADTASLDGVIPLNTGISRSFSNDPNIEIDHEFVIKFDDTSTDKRVVVIEGYTEPIKQGKGCNNAN
jgi:hypothetical protein